MAATLGTAAATMFLLDPETGSYTFEDSPFLGMYLPVIALVLAYIFYAIGFGPIPSVLSGEMLPNSAKACQITIGLGALFHSNILGFLVYHTEEEPCIMEADTDQ